MTGRWPVKRWATRPGATADTQEAAAAPGRKPRPGQPGGKREPSSPSRSAASTLLRPAVKASGRAPSSGQGTPNPTGPSGPPPQSRGEERPESSLRPARTSSCLHDSGSSGAHGASRASRCDSRASHLPKADTAAQPTCGPPLRARWAAPPGGSAAIGRPAPSRPAGPPARPSGVAARLRGNERRAVAPAPR